MLARTHFGLYGSTASPVSSTASAPAASAVRMTVPALPGSATPARTATSRAPCRACDRVGVVAAADQDQPLRVHGVGEARDRLVGDEGGADAGGPGADQQVALTVGHGVGDEEVDDGTRIGLGPGDGVVRGPHPLDEEAAGVLARRAPQQLAGCRDARGALGEHIGVLAQAAAPSSPDASAPFGTSATAALAVSTSAVKAAASDTAISARFLRSISTPASLRPCMNRL